MFTYIKATNFCTNFQLYKSSQSLIQVNINITKGLHIVPYFRESFCLSCDLSRTGLASWALPESGSSLRKLTIVTFSNGLCSVINILGLAENIRIRHLLSWKADVNFVLVERLLCVQRPVKHLAIWNVVFMIPSKETRQQLQLDSIISQTVSSVRFGQLVSVSHCH